MIIKKTNENFSFHLDPLIIAFFGFGRQSELSAFKSLVERIRRRPAISPQGMAFIHCALFFKNDEQIKPMMRKYFLDYTPSNQRHLKIMDFAWLDDYDLITYWTKIIAGNCQTRSETRWFSGETKESLNIWERRICCFTSLSANSKTTDSFWKLLFILLYALLILFMRFFLYF